MYRTNIKNKTAIFNTACYEVHFYHIVPVTFY